MLDALTRPSATAQHMSEAEWAIRVQLDAAAAGTLTMLSNEVAARSSADLNGFQGMQSVGEGVVEFEALMRKLDKTDSSYRH
jgi:hypothetical protein